MIAAVHGYVYGMAVNMALGCDLIVAETGTKFQVTETPRGLGGARYWVRRILSAPARSAWRSR